ncbi:N-substituted formamide deformylase [Sinobacterium norvegicum]|uniref:N-substituted formamide deformylase n=1 Tax=Sinobacterium norvegicum TaxID=1641715 RepID=A0ABM9AFE4_9GAMM|nr:amidohydrolase [Sinobacterium norvegicum]CAH0991930.1 N-substituted formamide deformylase [Sinobacterium norvegicum]
MRRSQYAKPGLPYSDDTVLFIGDFITVNQELPRAEAVAVKAGVFIAVGTRAEVELQLQGKAITYTVNEDFAGKTITPGFIEAHMHFPVAAIFTLSFNYGGQFDRVGLGGEVIKGHSTKESLQAHIRQLVAEHNAAGKQGEWINLWGLDPLLMTDDTIIDRDFLDALCDDSPFFYLHASCHLSTMNSRALAMVGYSLDDNPEFIIRKNGRLTGDIAELVDMYRAFGKGALAMPSPADSVKCMAQYSDVASRLGLTTVSDCGMGVPSDTYPAFQAVSQMESCKVRFACYPAIGHYDFDAIESMAAATNDRLMINKVKYLNTDGSIQGFTALLEEGDNYYNGNKNGATERPFEQMYEEMLPYHKAGYSISVHCNGQGMTTALLDIFERMQCEFPRPELRHCLEHNQMVTPAQMDRMVDLGVIHNLFGTHIAVWGDVHAKQTVGPDRVKTLNPFQTSVQKGIPFAIHCDDAVTQINPLFMMWASMTRQNIFSGEVLGEEECLTAEQALHAVTMGPAYLMEKDQQIGSIEVGKLADFAVLGSNPLTVDKQQVKDIKVFATVTGGKVCIHS